MEMFDLLSTTLETVRLRSMVFPRAELTAPWGIRFPKSPDEMPPACRPPLEEIPEPLRNRIPHPGGGFYAVIRGNCILDIGDGSEPITLTSGDLVVFLGPPGHVIRDSLSSAVKPIWEVHPPERARQRKGLVAGGGGATTTLLSGLYIFEDRLNNRLLSSLPPVLHLKAEDGRATPWLEDTVRFLSYETSEHAPGAMSVINHLAQVLFIQAVRAYVRTMPGGSGNWLQAMLDAEIGPALGFMHHSPEAPWTVASLADTVAMSRSAFAARFTQLVGEPPLQYLTHCRMQKATDLLRESDLAIKEIAAKVGYESEAAFSKAFKRLMGVAPGVYRKGPAGQVTPATAPTASEPLAAPER